MPQSISDDAELARRLQNEEIRAAALSGLRLANSSSRPPQDHRDYPRERSGRRCSRCNQPSAPGQPMISALGGHWHINCFLCSHCSQPITTSGSADFGVIHGKPLHKRCIQAQFPCCVVCHDRLQPSAGHSRLQWKEAPFWREPYCHHHDPSPSCRQCHRVQAPERLFDLPDGRKTCSGCTSGAVLITNDGVALLHGPAAVPPEGVGDATHVAFQAKGHRGLGDGISGWLERTLSIPTTIWPPLMVVEEGVLNAQAKAKGDFHTRGLTLSEEVRAAVLVGFDSRGRPIVQSVAVPGGSAVTGMFLLSGLPKWQAASVIAHEATHALLRLHKEHRVRIDLALEEGLCQLVAWCYLQHAKPRRPRSVPWPHRHREPEPKAYSAGYIDTDGDVTDYGAWAFAIWSVRGLSCYCTASCCCLRSLSAHLPRLLYVFV